MVATKANSEERNKVRLLQRFCLHSAALSRDWLYHLWPEGILVYGLFDCIIAIPGVLALPDPVSLYPRNRYRTCFLDVPKKSQIFPEK